MKTIKESKETGLGGMEPTEFSQARACHTHLVFLFKEIHSELHHFWIKGIEEEKCNINKVPVNEWADRLPWSQYNIKILESMLASLKRMKIDYLTIKRKAKKSVV